MAYLLVDKKIRHIKANCCTGIPLTGVAEA
jgi:hypothetical protein